MLRSKIGYETRVIRWVFAVLVIMDLIPAIMLLFVSDEEMWAIALIFAILSFTAVVFGLSPLLTKHEVHDTHIVLRQGWYYRNRIDLTDIVSIKRVKNGPWSYGVHFIGDGTIYVNGRLDDLILIEMPDKVMRTGKKRRMTKVLFDTLDNDAFLKMIGRDPDGEIERL